MKTAYPPAGRGLSALAKIWCQRHFRPLSARPGRVIGARLGRQSLLAGVTLILLPSAGRAMSVTQPTLLDQATLPVQPSKSIQSFAPRADATPPLVYPLPDGNPAWQEWGSGEMRYFGFRLYRATLWVAGPGIESSPHALLLQYRRDISRQQLVDASLDEMKHLGADEATVARWQADLQRVFPDVREGERIIGLHLPGKGARFYHQGRLIGEVNDAEFARRFFAIWLAPRTRSPDVRTQLLKRPSSAGG